MDTPMFTRTFKERWLHFFTRVIKGRFATLVGGIKEFSYVMEIQDRGSPHIHLVLWTGKTVQELIDMPNLVVADIPDPNENPVLYNQVVNLQTHNCTAYCMRMGNCRFGFPQLPRNDTLVDQDNRVHVKRSRGSEYINQYNPYLLHIWDASMDIQVCFDSKVEIYLAKYLSKSETPVALTSASDNTPREHFVGRKVGLVEAVYDIMGYHKHQTSLDVIYINTTMPHIEQRRQLKPASSLARLPLTSENIYTRTHLEKYQHRDSNTAHLTMLEYFRIYILNFSQQERLETEDIYAGEYDPRFRSNHNMLTRVRITIDGQRMSVYKYVRDLKQYIFKARTKIPLARYYNTNPQHGEQFYYQQIILNFPCRNFENARGNRLWREWFHELLINDQRFKNRFTQEFLDNVVEQEAILDRENRQTPQLIEFLQAATTDQKFTYDTILSFPVGVHLVHGGAGVGKSRLLQMFYLGLQESGFVPIKLAPTGVAANTIEGQTLHRFLGITNRPNVPNLVRIDQYFKDLEPGQRLALLIDEVSMVSSELLSTLETCLQQTTLNNIAFDIRPEGALPVTHPVFGRVLVHPLTTNVRVEPDQLVFKRFLNNVRIGVFDNFFFDIIASRTIVIPNNVLRVYVSNAERERYNDLRFDAVDTEPYFYNAIDNSSDIQSSMAAEETCLVNNLRLKIGVLVMLLHNISVEEGWIYGTIAVVTNMQRTAVEITKPSGERLIVHPITRTIYKTSISRSQIPLDLAFATTIHKVQSLTLPAVAVCLYNNFLSHGQFYVAISRVTRLTDLYFFPSVQHTTLDFRQDLTCLQAIENIEGNIANT